jgi:hypothetical protein
MRGIRLEAVEVKAMTSFTKRLAAEMSEEEMDVEIKAIETEIDSDGNNVPRFIIHYGYERLHRLLELKGAKAKRTR